MRRRLLITEQDSYLSGDLERLSKIFEVHRVVPRNQAELATAVREIDPEVLIVGLGIVVGRREVRDGRTLKIVVSPTTGTDHLRIEELETLGIQVISLRNMREDLRSVSSTAELAWGLVLILARQLVSAANSTSAGEWHREKFLGQQLRTKTLGVIGLGRLGRFVAQYGLAFGMRVVATDSAVTTQSSEILLVTIQELLAESDVISIHVPLNGTTRGMIGVNEVKSMKKGVLLVNTSRGEVVDEDAIASGIRSEHLGGYGTDVISGDSGWSGLVRANPITELVSGGFNVVVTPHIGGYTNEAVNHTRRLVVDYVLNHSDIRSS